MNLPDELITITPLENTPCIQMGPGDQHSEKGRLSILFIAKGGGHCLQGKQMLILEEKCVYTGILDRFRQIEMEEGSIGFVAGISGAVAYKGLFAVNRFCLRLEDEPVEEMLWLMNRIYKISRSKERADIEMLPQYVSILLLILKKEMADVVVQVSMNRKGLLIREFFELLEEAFMIARTVDYYAERLCVSPKHLTNVIKLESGFPTSYHINQRVVLEAKRMARTSGTSLKQIAYQLGYDDVAAFSKLFKRVSGENFSSYKYGLKLAFAKSGMDTYSR